MTHITPRYAFIQAQWHSHIVEKSLEGFCEIIPKQQIDVFNVPGAFEMPLLAKKLAKSGQYSAIVAAAFVVDGGIYRHDFVASAVVDGLMTVGLETGVPILSVSLTPHHYQDTEDHNAFFKRHFVEKGREAASAVLALGDLETVP